MNILVKDKIQHILEINKENGRFNLLFSSIEWKLKYSPEKVGEPTEKGLPLVYRVYSHKGPLKEDPKISLIFHYTTDKKIIDDGYIIFILEIKIN